MPNSQPRYLATLERLLAISATALKPALDEASDLIAAATNADKVDTFVHDQDTHTLVALGTSNTPMARLEVALGLDRLPIANGGRAVQVYETGVVFQHGQLDTDTEELLGIRESLGVRSTVCVPLIVDGVRRGAVQVDSARPEAFDDDDRAFLVAVTNWVGLVFHRSELVEQLTREAEKHARRLAAEEIVTVLAHDLRNHLSPLMNRVHALAHRAQRDRHAAYVDEANGITRRLVRLSDLLTDLLDVARLERGLFSLDRQTVDLGALAREAVATMESSSSSVQLRAADDVVVFVDAKRVRQALDNVLSNAARHATGSEVTVDVGSATRRGVAMAAVTVADRGPGIPADLLPRLTDPFVRGGTGRGLGIGLYLVRGIVDAHGGAIEIESTVGAGSTFRLLFPVSVDAPAPTRSGGQ